MGGDFGLAALDASLTRGKRRGRGVSNRSEEGRRQRSGRITTITTAAITISHSLDTSRVEILSPLVLHLPIPSLTGRRDRRLIGRAGLLVQLGGRFMNVKALAVSVSLGVVMWGGERRREHVVGP